MSCRALAAVFPLLDVVHVRIRVGEARAAVQPDAEPAQAIDIGDDPRLDIDSGDLLVLQRTNRFLRLLLNTSR